MIGRRALLAGLLPATAWAALPVPADNRLVFDVLRKGSRIGQHALTFSQAANTLTVEVAVDLSIGLGPISFFRYRHRAVEIWDADQVDSVQARTNDDGTPDWANAERAAPGLVVRGSSAPRYVAPPKSLPGTHWNKAMLAAPFINTQNGKLMSPKITLVGTENVDVAGRMVPAQHYTMRGDANLDTFYDDGPSWVGLWFTAKDGSVVTYRRVTP